MKCTLIIPCHNEEENVEPLYSAIIDVVGDSHEYDILFVDDGSTDRTLEKVKKLHQQDSRVKYISFLANYGHQKALVAGLRRCTEGFAITLDADLQHPPECIPAFIDQHLKNGADIVLGRRKEGQKAFLKDCFSRAFYALFPLVTGIKIPPNTSDFRLYSRRAIAIISSIKEPQPFLRALTFDLNLRADIVEYELGHRLAGSPSYTFMKSVRMALGAVLQYSAVPIRLGLIVGTLGVCLSLFLSAQYLFLRLFTDLLVPGQADLMVFLGLISSLILILLSLLLNAVSQVRACIIEEPSYIIAETEKEE